MSVTSKVVNSAMFAASAKLISKLLGVVSTMVLARILAPEEFGYIAIVSIALYFFDILSHAASEQYIIQKTTVSRRELHTAWTANLILKLAIALVIVLLAPWIAIFFERPELTNAFRLSALVLPIQALKSPIYILLKRQLNFAPLFWSSLAERLLAVPLVITLAFALESFWAFILTDIAAKLLAVVISYFIARKLPRFTLSGVAVQWTFSKWMMAKSVVGYMRSQIDTIVVSKAFSGGVLGNYHMARELAMMPAHFLLGPAIEPLLSAFKNDKDDKNALMNNVAFSLIVAMIISIPLCVFIWNYAETIVFILLGENWGIAATVLPILSLLFFYWTLMQIIETAFIANGNVRLIFVSDVVSLLLITVALTVGVTHSFPLEGLAWLRVLIGFSVTLLLIVFFFKTNLRYVREVFLAAVTSLFCCALAYSLAGSIGDVIGWSDKSGAQIWQSLLWGTVFFLTYAILLLLTGKLSNNYHFNRLHSILGPILARNSRNNRNCQ